MANFGLSRPTIAKLDPETGKYSDAIKCGKAINTSVTPNYNTAPLYADNMLQEEIREFKNADVELGVDTVPIKAAEMMFGHKISEDGEEVSNADDEGAYVGYGFITAETVSGKTVQGVPSDESKIYGGRGEFPDKGGFHTVFDADAVRDGNGNNEKDWRKKSGHLDTEEQCDEWIMKALGLSGTEPTE